MIQLFRNIRRTLLSENRLGRYFLYALGEIILVVIGILIALQINNWNEYKKDRIKERELLLQLQSEFQSNLDQLDSKIEMREELLSASLRLLDYIDHPERRDRDSILGFISVCSLTPTFDPIVNDIISSGRVQYILNPELKERLSRWTSEIVQVTEEEETWRNYVSYRVVPTLETYGATRSVVFHTWNNNVVGMFQLDDRKVQRLPLLESKKEVDLNKLLEHSDFEDHMANAAHFAKMTNVQSYALRGRITAILNVIEEELQQ